MSVRLPMAGRMSVRLAAFLLLPFIHGEVFQGWMKGGEKADDGCPRHFRLCNDSCLDRNTNHTEPCHTGPWGKCLSANFPFYCNVTDTCIKKDQLCGDHCFDGNPDSIWYDHTIYDKKGTFDRKVNLWKLNKNQSDEEATAQGSRDNDFIWLERYNCDGKCITYRELCKGGCEHPEQIMKGGSTKALSRRGTVSGARRGIMTQTKTLNMEWLKPMNLQKCGGECRLESEMKGFHICGDDCLSQDIPCNGTCPIATLWMRGRQWLCGNECRPTDRKSIKFQSWRGCPDGTCRDKSVNCDGPLPGSCPAGKILCRYHSWIRGTDFDCKSSSDYYVCNETREHGWVTKHPDNWCFADSEPCNGECRPGYLRCFSYHGNTLTCRNAKDYVKCGDRCEESRYNHNCNGSCINWRYACDGVCPEGFEKCGDRCEHIADSSFADCNGKCQPASQLCDGRCPKVGWFKFGLSGNVCKPGSEKDSYHECNGVFLDYKTACNETCVPECPFADPKLDEFCNRKLCRGGKCLLQWRGWDCEGECIDDIEHCNGVCKTDGEVPCGQLCKRKDQLESGLLRTCGDECISESELCDGNCGEGRVACGQRCISQHEAQGLALVPGLRECGDECLLKSYPCEGECPEERPFKCIGHRREEICLERKSIGDGGKDCHDGTDESTSCFRQWECDGQLQCINQPCHEQDPDSQLSVCPTHVNKTVNWRGDKKSYAMYYCAAEDECKLEGVQCDGTCMVDMNAGRYSTLKPKNQFACEDGSECIGKYQVCNGKKDCNDGSDEICRCKGDINCPERLRVNGPSMYAKEFRCESGNQYIPLRDYCNGKEDCNDGSDENCEKCAGIVQCKNGELVCANVPCNNTGINLFIIAMTGKRLEDFTCEGEVRRKQEGGGWDLCQIGPGQANCVRRSTQGNRYHQGTEGDVCNGQCLAGVLCGDKCLPEFPQNNGLWFPSCNGSCDHVNSSEPLVHCDGFCMTQVQLAQSRSTSWGSSHTTLDCDGECRVYANEMQVEKANSRTCNGACLAGGGYELEWFPCRTGDQCFSPKEWCDGVRNCEDGTDEADCAECPTIMRCYNIGANQTSSRGPRFPEYVCNNEPCGKCFIPHTFPCGNNCISTTQVCSITDLCSSPTQFKCDKCLEAADVCDGKEDCQDGLDEENCVNYFGSWICDGIIQSKTKPCV